LKRQTLNVQEAADFIGVSAWLIYDMVRLKQIPAIRIRTRIFFRIETLKQWMSDKEAAALEENAVV
jgi:excisionase family DNA binding protein